MYEPQPIDTKGVELPPEVMEVVEKLAASNHDNWARRRISEGWSYGPARNDELKQHPGLVPFEELSESEKEYDRVSSVETLKAIYALGYHIVRGRA